MNETVYAGGKACEGCPLPQLVQMGIKVGKWDYIIALAGNPNTGKSTVFNALTGLRQHTGNWPGKTVARMEGMFKYGEQVYKVVDLPGTYSLLATSEDEEIARDFILFGQPEVTVIVVDATRLERNLNLAFQVMEITGRVVIALNLMDEARRHGLEINHRRLARDLGVPVVPMAARSGEGLSDLLEAVAEVAAWKTSGAARRVMIREPQIQDAVDELFAALEAAYPGLPNAQWVALRLLDGDERITEALRSGELMQLADRQKLARGQRLEVVPA
jgi:ferrous iron transport protein B